MLLWSMQYLTGERIPLDTTIQFNRPNLRLLFTFTFCDATIHMFYNFVDPACLHLLNHKIKSA